MIWLNWHAMYDLVYAWKSTQGDGVRTWRRPFFLVFWFFHFGDRCGYSFPCLGGRTHKGEEGPECKQT